MMNLSNINTTQVAKLTIAAAAGGLAVNAYWYAATSKFLKKRLDEDTSERHQAVSDHIFSLGVVKMMNDIAQDSKGMSQADKLKIKELNDVAWMKKTPEERLEFFNAVQSTLLPDETDKAA